MPFSMQEFAAVVEALRTREIHAHHGSERRMTQRITVQTPIEMMPLQGAGMGEMTRVLTVDISPESLGLLTGRPIEQTHAFLAVLPRLQRSALMALYRARRVTSIAEGVFSVGAELTADAPRDVLLAIQSFADPRLDPLRDALRKLAGAK